MKKTSIVVLAIAMIAMVVFAVSGWQNNLQIAEVAFLTAGIASWIFLIMRFIIWRREKFLG